MNKTAKGVKWKGFLVGILFILLIWYSADLVTMGISLNTLTPWGPYCGVGTVLWIVLLWVICRIFIFPVREFMRLKNASFDIRYESAMSDLFPYRCQKADRRGGLHKDMNHSNLSQRRKQELLDEYFEIGDIPQESRKMIMNYSIATGTLTAFNRNKFADSLIMLLMQVRLLVDLSRLHGYKTSPVFSICCFGWVCTNSLLSSFLQDAADKVGELVSDGVNEISSELVSSSVEGQAMENGAESAVSALTDIVNGVTFGMVGTLLKAPAKLAGYMSRLAFEAAVNGAVVYGTGTLFLNVLEGTSCRETNKITKLLRFRREGRRKLFVTLLKKCVPDKKKADSQGSEQMDKVFKALRSSLNERRSNPE